MLANRLKQLRKENDMTQVEMAEKLNVSKGTVAMWEVDMRTPSVGMCKKIAELFGVSIESLISGGEATEEKILLDC